MKKYIKIREEINKQRTKNNREELQQQRGVTTYF